ncbi:D-glucuronyl C5-epimerase family protein [Thauera sp. JM12B12]|uniref:D-glucuronyl C5-epimerase family protein n=1 Tax=Thauera sp. JM12B12 TaxID=3142262 RepID=UPI0031F43B87
MNNRLKALSLRSRKALVTLVAATGVLAGCNQDLDYLSLRSHVPFASASSSSAQTDVDRAHHLVDADGIPFLSINNVGKQRHPAWIALYALAYAGREVYDERLAGLEDDLKFQACIDWLENNLRQDKHGQWVWQYHFDSTYNDISIKAPWSSAFAQATGIQALLVAYERTGESRYIDLAKKAAQPLFTPLRAGGFLFEAGADIWFEEIPEPIENPGHILNGHMRVLLALADLHEATNDETAATWLQRGTDTLHRWLPKFDTGYWLRYDLNPRKEDLLFRFANPYGFPAHALAIDKITLRDPVSKTEVSVDVGSEMDATGAARIAGTHWGQIEEVAGRSARKLIPAALDDKPDEMRAPHTYFYVSLPGEWKDNLRDQWYELIIEYYDDIAANITIQQRSIAPGQTFRDMRDGDLHLNGARHWRKWIIPVRPSDLGYSVGRSYASKHFQYLAKLSERKKGLEPWARIAAGYLNLTGAPALVNRVEPKGQLSLPDQTPLLPIYSLDSNGVVRLHIGDSSTKWQSDGKLDPASGRGTPVYSPYIVAEQLISGSEMPGASSFMDNAHLIRKDSALHWLLDPANYSSVNNTSIYYYPFDNTYNDIASRAPWPSAFGQAYVLKSLVRTFESTKENDESLKSAIKRTGLGFSVELGEGGITHIDRSGHAWYEEVPNGTHVLNAHLVSVPQLAEASRTLNDKELNTLSSRAILALREKLNLFDTGYWLRYDQNPRKELLIQLDWIDGDRSPLIDTVLLQNPQTGKYISLDIGTPTDAEGHVRLSGTEWGPQQIVDGRTVRHFSNGYQTRDEAVQGGTTHNAFLILQLPDWDYADVFDTPPHRLIIRYKDTGKGNFAIKTQAIHEGNRLTFVPLRGGIWTLQGDQQWKEAVFTIRPQDMGWYKGPDYQQYEVEQLQRIANLTNDWFFYQYADRHRDFLARQRDGVAAIVEKQDASNTLPITLRVLDAGGTYPGHGFENSIDGDPNDDYTAGLENDTNYVVVELEREVRLAAIGLHWESEQNRADFVRVRELLSDGSIGRTLAEGSPGPGQVVRMRLDPGHAVRRLRIDFGAFAGQARILLRQIKAIEAEHGITTPSLFRRDTNQFLTSTDPANPLNVFRIPITESIRHIARSLVDDASSDHDKIVEFMRYIGQFKVGVASDSSPEATVTERIGACGTFTNTLLALSASQNLRGRVISMLNFPTNDGHAVAEIFTDGKWRLYDPTYGTYYIDRRRPEAGALSFDEIKTGFMTGAVDIGQEVLTYRPGLDRFTGRDIFVKADPSGVIGPDRPMVFRLFLDATDRPQLLQADFGPKFQGANFLGAASTNQNHEWIISGLTPGHAYIFSVEPEYLGGDIEVGDSYIFSLFSTIEGERKKQEEVLHNFDFSMKPVAPWRIHFVADNAEIKIILSHRYRGPRFRYMWMKSYRIERMNEENS